MIAGAVLTIDEKLRDTAERLKRFDTAWIEARAFVCVALEMTQADLVAYGREPIADAAASAIDAMITRRLRNEPFAYIIGYKEFWSLPFELTPGVLVPRPDSETLIEAVLATRPDRSRPYRLLDLGVGSGCLLGALLHEYPKAVGLGIDRSEVALSLARRNLHKFGFAARVRLAAGNWASAVTGNYDIIVSNPPYIADGARSALSADILDYEPHGALFAGRDGLDDYRRIIADAPRFLAAGGLLVLEMGAGQSQDIAQLARDAFLNHDLSFKRDLAGYERALVVEDLAKKALH